MKKTITTLLVGLLLLAFCATSWADGENTSTVFKSSGRSGIYYGSHNSFRGFEALEALDALGELDDLDDELEDLDLELDQLDNELSNLNYYRNNRHRYSKQKYSYNYNYDYDHDFDFDFDFDFDDDDHHVIHFGDFHNFKYCNNMDIDIEDGEVYITHSGHRSGTVRITDDYSLYVNGKHIKTNSEQKRLIEEFYNSAEKLQKYAKIIGVKGAEIGIEGAKIGISAIGGLFKLILPGYDTDDYERDIERKSKGIEYKASLLEKEADALEHIAYDMEDIADELKDEIPELQRLRWF